MAYRICHKVSRHALDQALVLELGTRNIEYMVMGSTAPMICLHQPEADGLRECWSVLLKTQLRGLHPEASGTPSSFRSPYVVNAPDQWPFYGAVSPKVGMRGFKSKG